MCSSNEVLNFVIVLEGVLVYKEFVRLVHTAERHITAQLRRSNRISLTRRHKSFSFNFNSHGRDVFNEHLDEILHITL